MDFWFFASLFLDTRNKDNKGNKDNKDNKGNNNDNGNKDQGLVGLRKSG